MLINDTEELKKELAKADNINNFLSENDENFLCYTLKEYKWDSVVFYALYKHKNIEETNKLLSNCNLSPLLGDMA